MKILQLIQKPQLRGAEIFASQLSARLQNDGCELLIVSLFPGTAKLPFEGKMIHLNSNFRHRFWNIKAWYSLYIIIKREMPDIVQANAGFTLKFAVFSKMVFRWKQPIVFRNASTISRYIKTGFAIKWNSLFFRYTSRIISVSNNCAMDFVNLFPEHHKKVSVIPVGIEGTQNAIVYPEKPTGPVVIHVGGFTFEKNHTGLISIFGRLVQKSPEARLWLVGEGPLRRSVEAACMNAHLSDQIVFLGSCENVLHLISKADVLVLPSIIEGLPATILEAFYSRVPVVAYDVGGISEILIDGVTGRLISPFDEEAFVNAIMQAMEKTDENLNIIEAAYELVNNKFMNNSIAKRFEHAYAAIINRNRTVDLCHALN